MNVQHWQDRLYPDRTSRDPVGRFVATLDRYLDPSCEVLDLGAGAGEKNPYAIKGRVKRLVGVDLSPRVLENPLLDEGVVADLTALPFADASFDLAFSIYVMEHIRDPKRFAQEVARVLKPGGRYLSLTPNRYHYVTLVSSLTPSRFHTWLNQRRGRAERDTFPTAYRLNTRRDIKRHFAQAGLETVDLTTIEVQPNYLTFSTPTFLAGAVYERLVNATDLFAALRVNIICTLQKPLGVRREA